MKTKPRMALPRAAPAPPGGFRHDDRAEIPEAALTFRERKVLTALRASTEPQTVKQLARTCFPGMRAKGTTYRETKADGSVVRHATAPSYRCVVNSLRRLVVGGFAEKVARGTYAASSSTVASPRSIDPSTTT